MFDSPAAVATPDAVESFIDRWKDTTGTENRGFIDLYERGAFVLEAN
jgi:hypothetical protein